MYVCKSVQVRATALIVADIGKWQEELAGFARDYTDNLQEVLPQAHVEKANKPSGLAVDSSFRVLPVPESLSKWATDSLAATAKASHCHVGAVWCLVLAELRELDKQGVRVRRGKRASVRATKESSAGTNQCEKNKDLVPGSLTHILDEITEEDGSLDWEWPVFEKRAFGSCQTVVTPTLELDIYCSIEEDTIEAVAEDCDAKVSDVLTFSTYFNSSLGADIPSLARCRLSEETLLVLRVRHLRVRGGALVALTGPAKQTIRDPAPKPASSSPRRTSSSSSAPASSSSQRSSSSSSSFSSSAAASSSASKRGLSTVEHDPLKDLNAVELMSTKRPRKNVSYTKGSIDYGAFRYS